MNILKDFISLVINKLNTSLNNEITRATAEESRLDTDIQGISSELSTDYQKKLVAGENITIDPDTNEISAGGGGGDIYAYCFDFEKSPVYGGFIIYSSKNIETGEPTILITKEQVLNFITSILPDNIGPEFQMKIPITYLNNMSSQALLHAGYMITDYYNNNKFLHFVIIYRENQSSANSAIEANYDTKGSDLFTTITVRKRKI